MIKIIKIILFYPTIYLMQKIITRFALILGASIFAATLYFSTNLSDQKTKNNIVNANTPIKDDITKNLTEEVTIQKGDNLTKILYKQNLPDNEIKEIIKLAKSAKITSNLRIGQKIKFDYKIKGNLNRESGEPDRTLSLNKISLKISKIKSIDFVKQNNKFSTQTTSTKIKKLIVRNETVIKSNLITSLKKSGISNSNIMKIIKAYSNQIDFKRQIKSGDKITIISEKFVTDKNDFSHHGKILHASLKTKSNEYNIYNYSPDKNTDTEFFSESGHAVKGNLLRKPVKFSRISGHFGYRKKHPVLGYGAMHKGVDFAAPTGTPIYASANGTVEFIGRKSGYGKFIVLKHKNKISTAYAHASRFAKNLKRGSRVKQGQLIAYVGQTGRATGPHLHYEVRINGKHVNPMKFKLTPKIKLAGAKLARFKKYKKDMKQLGKKLSGNIEIAAAKIPDTNLF